MGMFLRIPARAFATVAALLLCSFSSLAHSPYFTQIEKTVLPGGEIGEIRLVHGDGIFAVDPVRVVIVNPQGKVLARSYKTVPMVIVCHDTFERRCHAFDFRDNQVLEPAPAAFNDRLWASDIWNVFSGEDWGFAVRPATAVEILEANLVYAKSHMQDFIIPFVLAAGLVAVFLLRPHWSLWPSNFRWLNWVLVISFRLLIAAFLLFLSLVSVWLSGITVSQWLSLSIVGGCVAIGVIYLLRRTPRPRAIA